MQQGLARATLALAVLAAQLGAIGWPAAAPARAHELQQAAEDHATGHQHGTQATRPVQDTTEIGVAPLLGNLGTHQHRITTRSELAQRYFDEGLILSFGFNHAEAIRSFRDAATLDATCAMCYWGIAYAHGPHINAAMADAAVAEAYAALERAIGLAGTASPAEQAYIQALAARYSPTPVADRAPLDRAYADAMREVARRFPDDLDAATLYAEALMDLTPWEYWTKDGQPTEYTAEIVATLEGVLARNPRHPGANHFYIHAVEASQTPERAVPSAERLETIVPGAGHLVHMPAHIYWRVGRYQDAIRINQDAIRSDETYFRVGGVADLPTHGLYVFGYYPHNIHFVFAAAQMSGQSALALEAARKLVERVPDDVVRAAPALEDFPAMPLQALVRFGRWDEVLREPRPAEDLQFTTGLWHWARGLAYVRQGQIERAEGEAAQLASIASSPALRELELFSRSTGATLLELAGHVLAGELAGARGQTREQIARLERAVAIQDALPYMEPPSWFYPVRHTLGAALLAAGRPAEAEAVYREDLRQYPNNGRALFGLAESLRAQGKADEAAEAQRRFEDAWQHADVILTSTGF